MIVTDYDQIPFDKAKARKLGGQGRFATYGIEVDDQWIKYNDGMTTGTLTFDTLAHAKQFIVKHRSSE